MKTPQHNVELTRRVIVELACVTYIHSREPPARRRGGFEHYSPGELDVELPLRLRLRLEELLPALLASKCDLEAASMTCPSRFCRASFSRYLQNTQNLNLVRGKCILRLGHTKTECHRGR